MSSKKDPVYSYRQPDLSKLTNYIREWAYDRELDKQEPSKQLNKLIEEIGELSSAISKDNGENVVEELGDNYVVLTILAMQLGLRIEDCVKIAYEKIKNRKGKTINGVFIKESDLTN